MLNVVWFLLIFISVIIGAINGKLPDVVNAVTSQAKAAFEIALGLAGILTFWLGIMKIAENAGLIQLFARVLNPIMKRLFPDVPPDHPAMGSMVMNMAANFLGLNNAATPFGLRAMAELEKLNKFPGTATDAMCTFLAINTSSIQLIPATAIAYLAAAGADHPTDIIVTSLIATSTAMVAAVTTAKCLARWRIFKINSAISINTELNVKQDAIAPTLTIPHTSVKAPTTHDA